MSTNPGCRKRYLVLLGILTAVLSLLPMLGFIIAHPPFWIKKQLVLYIKLHTTALRENTVFSYCAETFLYGCLNFLYLAILLLPTHYRLSFRRVRYRVSQVIVLLPGMLWGGYELIYLWR